MHAKTIVFLARAKHQTSSEVLAFGDGKFCGSAPHIANTMTNPWDAWRELVRRCWVGASFPHFTIFTALNFCDALKYFLLRFWCKIFCLFSGFQPVLNRSQQIYRDLFPILHEVRNSTLPGRRDPFRVYWASHCVQCPLRIQFLWLTLQTTRWLLCHKFSASPSFAEQPADLIQRTVHTSVNFDLEAFAANRHLSLSFAQ